MKKLWIPIVFATTLLVGCSSREYAEANQAGGGGSAASMPEPGGGTTGSGDATLVSHQSAPSQKRDVVKKGNLSVEVVSVEGAEKKARSLVEGSGGRVDRVSSSNLAGTDAMLQMTLRVPVAKFEDVMAGLEALGVRTQKAVEVQDVTEQTVDLDARVRALAAQESSLVNMLAKSKNLSDTLTIKNDISRLRGEIESIQGQRKSLKGEASYSSLELTLQQSATAAAVASTNPNWMQGSWAQAWGAGMMVFRGLIGILMWILVFSPIWVPVALVIRWAIRTSSPAQKATH